jgi:hypothetical protein
LKRKMFDLKRLGGGHDEILTKTLPITQAVEK